jgi:hypothetical protein
MLACHGGGSGPEYMLLQGPLHEVRRHGIVEFRHGSILGGRWLFDFLLFRGFLLFFLPFPFGPFALYHGGVTHIRSCNGSVRYM